MRACHAPLIAGCPNGACEHAPYACFFHSAPTTGKDAGNAPRYLTEIPEELGKWGLEMRKTISALVVALMLGWAGAVHAGDFQKGLEAYNAGDYATALLEWRDLAEQGDAEAQYNLGVMYDNGQGVAQDYAEAVKWYRRAAEQGDA